MENFSNIKIISINPRNHLLLSENNQLVITNDFTDLEITMHPLAFPVKETGEVRFEVELSSISTSLKSSELQGVSSTGIILFSGPIKNATVEVKAQIAPSNLCSLINHSIEWKIVLESKKNILIGKTQVELYWINTEHLEKTFYRKGISLEALRIMTNFGSTPTFPNSDKTDIENIPATQIISNVFYYIPPVYDIYNGAPHFVTINGDFNNITLHWTAFLAAHGNWGSLLNCYDAAAIAQYWLSYYRYDSTYCFMAPFGYLAKTLLIGRGNCNNPFFGKSGGSAVVDQQNLNRTAFANHAFLKLNNDGVGDSCAGPHVANEYVNQYIQKAVDKVYPIPPRVVMGTVNDVSYYKGITHVDFISSINTLSSTPNLVQLKNLINYSEPDWESFSEEAVVGQLPHPTEAGVLDLDWVALSEEIVPGENEILKMWMLKNKTGICTIKIFTISGSKELAHNRFLSLGSAYQTVESPYKNSLDNLGEYSIETNNNGYSRCIALFQNMVVEITTTDTKIDALAILEFYYKWAQQHLTSEISSHFTKNKLKLNLTDDLIQVSLNSNNNITLEFSHNEGCQLVDMKQQELIFKKTKKEFNLNVLLIDNETLLVTTEHFSS